MRESDLARNAGKIINSEYKAEVGSGSVDESGLRPLTLTDFMEDSDNEPDEERPGEAPEGVLGEGSGGESKAGSKRVEDVPAGDRPDMGGRGQEAEGDAGGDQEAARPGEGHEQGDRPDKPADDRQRGRGEHETADAGGLDTGGAAGRDIDGGGVQRRIPAAGIEVPPSSELARLEANVGLFKILCQPPTMKLQQCKGELT